MVTQANSDVPQSNSLSHLNRLGWDDYFHQQLSQQAQEGELPARVIEVNRKGFKVDDGSSQIQASVSGNLINSDQAHFPIIGDWVLLREQLIVAVLTRKNALSRGAAGTYGKQDPKVRKEQHMAANLDAVFIVCGLDRDFNLRRIERYLTLIYNCGLTPVILLTKADLHPDPQICAEEVENIAFGVPVHLISLEDDECLHTLEPYLRQGTTITLTGSSGAGKSTLINRLYGKDIQLTGEVSHNLGKGKHTTTTRQLFTLPSGSMVIDNPGIREIGFADNSGAIDTVFPEIEEYAASCRFPDCSHSHEPGCEVQAAIASGDLSAHRLENYLKMKKELNYVSERESKSSSRIEKEQWKGVAMKIKAMKKKR